ncbi:hypothetical protein [Anaerotruncus colihominis]|nr:hypothetical protein [Anaerotruncus colihominis]
MCGSHIANAHIFWDHNRYAVMIPLMAGVATHYRRMRRAVIRIKTMEGT